MTLKQLAKTINVVYAEKLSAGKEAVTVRMAGLAAFVYDSYINKYGLLNVAERKLKEMLLAVVLHRSASLHIELCARFLGLSSVRYSGDDLNFLLALAQQLFQKYVEGLR